MKLFNVRKGQFVYYRNQLHKVYAVKPFFKQSVHLIRLNDFTQHLVAAKEIDLYNPRHLDSFIFNFDRYTLHKEIKAKVGDYIIVVKPQPDSLDHHYLHAIEMVAAIENNGIISYKTNGIKHVEYWVMASGLLDGANKIDLQNPDTDEYIEQMNVDLPKNYIPKIGDVYQRTDSNTPFQAMVVAIEDDLFYLGSGTQVSLSDLNNAEKWVYLFNPVY